MSHQPRENDDGAVGRVPTSTCCRGRCAIGEKVGYRPVPLNQESDPDPRARARDAISGTGKPEVREDR
jgi:hypothetical protein